MGKGPVYGRWCPAWAVGPWTSHLTFIVPQFFIFELRIRTIPTLGAITRINKLSTSGNCLTTPVCAHLPTGQETSTLQLGIPTCVCVCVYTQLSACLCVCVGMYMGVQMPQRPEALDSCRLELQIAMSCLTLVNSGPRQEQYGHLTAELSLQPSGLFCAASCVGLPVPPLPCLLS